MELLREEQQHYDELYYYGLWDPPLPAATTTLQMGYPITAATTPTLEKEEEQGGLDSEGSMTADLMRQYHQVPFLEMVQQQQQAGAATPPPGGSFQLLLRMQEERLLRHSPEVRFTHMYGAETDDDSSCMMPPAVLPPSSLESCVTHASEELQSTEVVCRDKVPTLTAADVATPAQAVKRRTRRVKKEEGVEYVTCYNDDDMEGPCKRQKKKKPAPSERKKRKRTRVVSTNNKREEELESQRMSHIAVERNRRRLMNDHLASLRELMPPYYIQRGDQASIVGGAIEFVKELEQHLQTLLAEKHTRASYNNQATRQTSTPWTTHRHSRGRNGNGPFDEFFISPQYRTTLGSPSVDDMQDIPDGSHQTNPLAVADIEAAVTQTHVNLRVMVPRRPGQLLRFIATLEDMRLSVLHLNVSSFQDHALYSLNLKMEDDCKLGSGDEIAAAVNQIFSYIAFATTGYS